MKVTREFKEFVPIHIVLETPDDVIDFQWAIYDGTTSYGVNLYEIRKQFRDALDAA